MSKNVLESGCAFPLQLQSLQNNRQENLLGVPRHLHHLRRLRFRNRLWVCIASEGNLGGIQLSESGGFAINGNGRRGIFDGSLDASLGEIGYRIGLFNR